MKAVVEKNGHEGKYFVFFYFECLFSLARTVPARNRDKFGEKQCPRRLVSLAQRRLVRLDATAFRISFAVRRGPPGGRSIPRHGSPGGRSILRNFCI